MKQLPLKMFPAERLTTEGYTKLLPRRLVPYLINSVDLELVKILQDVIEETVSINLIFGALRRYEYNNNDTANKELRASKEVQPRQHDPKLRKEYAMESIVGHIRTENRVSYSVQWYDYDAIDDTYEFASHTPSDFIDRF